MTMQSLDVDESAELGGIMKHEDLPHHFLTESEALRFLNWPTSRREKLRELVPNSGMSLGKIYMTKDIRQFQEKLNAHAASN